MGEVPVPGSLDELIEKIFDLLGNKGLDELNENEVTTLKALMANYKSNPADWKKYALFDPMNYTRNLVSNGNGKFNLMVLCWGTGQQSSIHDHSAAHCIVKMLDGELSETRFDWPEQQGVPLNAKNVTKLHRDETTYMHDKIGLHRVENASHVKEAVSLHLYTPPYSECQSFDLKTGFPGAANITFYSVNGVKVERNYQS